MTWLQKLGAALVAVVAVVVAALTFSWVRKSKAKDQALSASYDRAEQLEKEKAEADLKIATDKAQADADAKVKAAQEKAAKGAQDGSVADTLRRLGG